MTSRAPIGRPLGASALRSSDTSWSPGVDEEQGLQPPGAFVLDMPYGGFSYRQAQVNLTYLKHIDSGSYFIFSDLRIQAP